MSNAALIAAIERFYDAVTTTVGQQTTNLVGGAPTTLDTLGKLAAAIGNDPSYADTVASALATKETPSGATSKITAALQSHVSSPDPHEQYVLEANVGDAASKTVVTGDNDRTAGRLVNVGYAGIGTVIAHIGSVRIDATGPIWVKLGTYAPNYTTTTKIKIIGRRYETTNMEMELYLSGGSTVSYTLFRKSPAGYSGADDPISEVAIRGNDIYVRINTYARVAFLREGGTSFTNDFIVDATAPTGYVTCTAFDIHTTASLKVQTSATDNTAGSVMRVGAFGLGEYQYSWMGTRNGTGSSVWVKVCEFAAALNRRITIQVAGGNGYAAGINNGQASGASIYLTTSNAASNENVMGYVVNHCVDITRRPISGLYVTPKVPSSPAGVWEVWVQIPNYSAAYFHAISGAVLTTFTDVTQAATPTGGYAKPVYDSLNSGNSPVASSYFGTLMTAASKEALWTTMGLGSAAGMDGKGFPFPNLMSDSGRFSGKIDPLLLQCGNFEPSDFLGSYNGSVQTSAGKFIQNNTTNGGSDGVLTESVSSLLVRLGRTASAARYGAEFHVAKITAGAGTQSPAVGLDSTTRYLTTVNNLKAFVSNGGSGTAVFYVRLVSGSIHFGRPAYVDGVSTPAGTPLSAGWKHVRVIESNQIGYDNSHPRIYAEPGSVIEVALAGFFSGVVDGGLHTSPIPAAIVGGEHFSTAEKTKLNELSTAALINSAVTTVERLRALQRRRELERKATLRLKFTEQDYVFMDGSNGLMTGPIEEIVTVTRSSVGGRFNSQGIYEQVPANKPRINYDPVTGQCLGILQEEKRTNLIPNSQMQSPVSWTISNSGAKGTSFPGTVPHGFANVVSGTVASGQANAYISRQFTLELNTKYTLTALVWLDPAIPVDKGTLSVYKNSSGWVALQSAIIPERGTWVWATMSFTTDATVAETVVGAGCGGSGVLPGMMVYCAAMQLEKGETATSFILNNDTLVPREADVIAVKNFSKWGRGKQGTLSAIGSNGKVAGSPGYMVALTNGGSSAESVNITRNSFGEVVVSMVSGGTSQISGPNAVTIMADGARVSTTVSYGDGVVDRASNGVIADTISSATIPNITSLRLGDINDTRPWNGHIEEVMYVPFKVTRDDTKDLSIL